MYVILVYDIKEKRVAKILKICRKYLNWVQNSVFEGEITKGNYALLKSELNEKIIKDEDSILFFEMMSDKVFKKSVIGYEKNDPTNNII